MSEPKIFREFLESFSIPWWTVVCLQETGFPNSAKILSKVGITALLDVNVWFRLREICCIRHEQQAGILLLAKVHRNQLTGLSILKLDIVTSVMVHCGDWECLLGAADSSWLLLPPYGLSQETKFSVWADLVFTTPWCPECAMLTHRACNSVGMHSLVPRKWYRALRLLSIPSICYSTPTAVYHCLLLTNLPTASPISLAAA